MKAAPMQLSLLLLVDNADVRDFLQTADFRLTDAGTVAEAEKYDLAPGR